MDYALGRLRFSVVGDGSLLAPVTDELRPIAEPLPPGVAARLEFRFGPCPELPPLWTLASPTKSWESGFQLEGGGLRYHYERASDPRRVWVEMSTYRRSLKQRVQPLWLRRARDWNYLDYEQTVAKNFMYDVFDYLTQLESLEVEQSYVHASSFEKGGEAVGVFAWGGIGKTTSMLRMVIEDDWKFLSDDLGVLSVDGSLWRAPKKMQIYAYNLANEARLSEVFMKERSALDRLSWAWMRQRRGPSRVRRRVSAEELFGGAKVSRRAALKWALFAERTSSSRFVVQPLTRAELAERATAIVMREIEPFSLVRCALEGAGHARVLQSYDSLRTRTKELLEAALERATISLWKIPERATPSEIHRELRAIVS